MKQNIPKCNYFWKLHYKQTTCQEWLFCHKIPGRKPLENVWLWKPQRTQVRVGLQKDRALNQVELNRNHWSQLKMCSAKQLCSQKTTKGVFHTWVLLYFMYIEIVFNKKKCHYILLPRGSESYSSYTRKPFKAIINHNNYVNLLTVIAEVVFIELLQALWQKFMHLCAEC